MEKNIQCSFQELPEQDKQLLRERYNATRFQSSESLLIYDLGLEKEFQELIKQGFCFTVEKMAVKSAKHISYDKYPDEEALCSVLTFDKSGNENENEDSTSYANATEIGKTEKAMYNGKASDNRSKQRRNHSVPTPLPNHTKSPTPFKLYKVTRNHLMYEALQDDTLCRVSGEDESLYAAYRRGLENWYQSLIDHSAVSEIAFHQDMTLCGNIILHQKSRPLYKTPGTAKIKELLGKIIISNKVAGLKSAQVVIDKLNSPNNMTNKDYLTAVHNIIAYSVVNAGVSIMNEIDYKSLLFFLNGFISTSMLKQLVQRFGQSLAEEKAKNSAAYYRYRYLGLTFPFIHSFFLKNATMLYVPSYNFCILKEFHEDLLEFKDAMLTQRTCMLEKSINLELTEIDSFLSHYIFHNKKLLDSYDNTYFADFKPPMVYPIISHFVSKFSSTAVNIQFRYKSISTIERILCMYWMVLASVLDNVFPETIFLFNFKFSGAVRFCGFDISFVHSIFHDLESEYKLKDPELYDFLYRKTIYLTRMQSFFSYRWRIYDRNIQALQIYPDTPLFEKVRYQSRKLNFVDEVQITSLKYDVVKPENYPRNCKEFVDDDSELGLAKPNHRKHVSFKDTNYAINANVDKNFKMVQQQLRANIEIYLLSPLDKRTIFGNHDHKLKLQQMLRDEHLGTNYAPPAHKSQPVLSGFNINTFPLHMMQFSEFGLLLNIDYRPDLVHGSKDRLSNKTEFFSQHELTLHYLSNDWNLLAERSSAVCLEKT